MDVLIYILPLALLAISLVLGFFPRYRSLQLTYSYLALVLITIASAFRADVGFDWSTYRYLFEGLRTLETDDAFNSASLAAYEPGFRALAALLIGDSWKEQSMLVLSSLLLTGSVLALLASLNRSHRSYAICTWLLISVFPIYFGQVRQAFALSITFFGLYIFHKFQYRPLALFVISLGSLFHASCIIYILIFATSSFHRFWLLIGKNAIYWGALALMLSLLDINIINLFSAFSPKAAIYTLTMTASRGPMQAFFWLSVLVLGCKLSSDLIGEVYLRSLVISSLFYTAMLMVLFSGTYAIFSRTFSFSSFYLGVISSYALARFSTRSIPYTLAVSFGAVLYSAMQVIYYWDEFIPYTYSLTL